MTQPIHPVLERVARAMCDGNWDAASVLETPSGETPDEFRGYWRDKARAAIQTLIEPDESMSMCGWTEASQDGDPEECYTAMLKPLLGDEG